MILNQRGTGMARQVSRPVGKAYRYKGIPGWNPALVPAPPGEAKPAGDLHGTCLVARQQRQARLARFAAFRAAGMTVREAGEAIGVGGSTARAYEAVRRAAAEQKETTS